MHQLVQTEIAVNKSHGLSLKPPVHKLHKTQKRLDFGDNERGSKHDTFNAV